MKPQQSLSNARTLLHHPYHITIGESWCTLDLTPVSEQVALGAIEDHVEFPELLESGQ